MAQNVETPAEGAVRGSEARSIAGAIDCLSNSASRVDLQGLSAPPDPFVAVGAVAADIAGCLAWRRKVAELRRRGDRLLAEFLAELSAECLIATYVDELIDRYLAIDSEAIELVSADRLPQGPLHQVRP